jgi:S1-C subfamily serine protease
MGPLEQLSEAFATAARSGAERTVRVEGRRRLPSSGILWGEGGMIVTANHTMERGDRVRVGLPGGMAGEAQIIGRDPTTDIAVLRLPDGGGTPSSPHGVHAVEVGHLVLALGRPGETHQASMGIVSAVDGAWRTPSGGAVDRFLQTDVVMYPGFSGGPLVDAWGSVVGMNTSGLVRGLSLALPVETLERVAAILAKHGRVRRGYLGVGVQPAKLQPASARAAERDQALLVSSVEPEGPADKGGVMLGDVLLALGGTGLGSMEDLLTALSADVVGHKVALDVLRGGGRVKLEVTIGERPAPEESDE